MINKIYIKEIYWCKDCPNCKFYSQSEDWCIKARKIIESIDKIPNWCPLKDKDD